MYLYSQSRYDYLNYGTRFSVTGSLNVNMKVNCCFGYIYPRIKKDMDNTYCITLFPNKRGLRYKLNNNCPFTDEQILNHLNELNNFYPVEISLEHKGYLMYVFLRIANAPVVFHKYALAWTRYLYEFPFNMLLQDALHLKQWGLRKVPMHNIMNLMICCCPCNLNGQHHLIKSRTFSEMTYKELKDSFLYADTNFSLWLHTQQLNERKLSTYQLPLYICREKSNDKKEMFHFSTFKYWDKGYYSKYRRPVYLKTYKMFKEERKKNKKGVK